MSESSKKIGLLSLVIPCYNEAENVAVLFEQLLDLNLPENEVIFVDDGSIDNTWQQISALLSTTQTQVKAVKFTKNFGKEAAIEAGLSNSTGDVVITLDADMEHPVASIPEMIDLWEQNPDVHVVNAIKTTRQKESLIKKVLTYLYFKLFSLSSGVDLTNHTDFKLLDRAVVDGYLSLPERGKFYRGLVVWLGFTSIEIGITVNDQPKSQSSWKISQLFKYAKSSILSFSVIPLRMISWLGLSLFIFSVILTIDTLIKTFSGSSAEGFPTVILLILGVGSVIIFSLGIIGEYLAEIYSELKGRPQYILKETKTNKGNQ